MQNSDLCQPTSAVRLAKKIAYHSTRGRVSIKAIQKSKMRDMLVE